MEPKELDVVAALNKAAETKISRYPITSNNASAIGHVCERYLVYRRLNWKDATPLSVYTLRVMEQGNIHEKAFIMELMAAGIKVVRSGQPFRWEEYQISGKQDFAIEIKNGVDIPCEFKSMAPHGFAGINEVKDFFKSDFYQKYPAQLTMYLLMNNKDLGLFILKNRDTGEIKQLWYELDYVYAETLVKKCERINKHVEAKTYPERINYGKTCKWCEYSHICLKNINFGEGAEIIIDEPLIEELKRRAELEPGKREFDALDKKLKTTFKEKPRVIAGDFIITGDWVQKKAYSVEASKYWKVDIEQLETGTKPKGMAF